MRLAFTKNGWADYLFWQQTDKTMVKRINRLIDDILRSPFEGIGKPEPLKHNWAGWWSRRVDEEHRLMYRLEGDVIEMSSCRFHYGD